MCEIPSSSWAAYRPCKWDGRKRDRLLLPGSLAPPQNWGLGASDTSLRLNSDEVSMVEAGNMIRNDWFMYLRSLSRYSSHPIRWQVGEEHLRRTEMYYGTIRLNVWVYRGIYRVAHLLWERDMLTPNLKLRLVVNLSCDPGQWRNFEFDVNINLSQSRWATL